MKIDFEVIYKQFKGDFSCPKNCADCCNGKIAEILDFLPTEHEYLSKKVPKAKNHIKTKKINGLKFHYIKQPCPFLKNNLCTIRQYRPIDCRMFPFDYCIFKNKIITFISDEDCPIVKRISKQDIKKFSRKIINILSQVDKKFVKTMTRVGSCGNCQYKKVCNQSQEDLIFIKKVIDN